MSGEGMDDSSEITDDDIVILVDEDGNETPFVVMALAEIDGVEYGLLTPQEQLEDDDNDEMEFFVLIREPQDDDTELWRGVEDDETYQKAVAFFETMIVTEDEE